MKRKNGKYAWSVTVGANGEIVVPEQAREAFDVQPGDTLILLGEEGKGLSLPPKKDFAKYASFIFETLKDDE